MIAFNSEHIQAIYTEHPSDYLLITFAEASMKANGRRFYGSNLTEHDKVATLGFLATRPNWYPKAEMAKAVEAVQPILDRFGERVSIGNSMGGYACIKHARLLRCDTSIAISPQFSVDPSDIPQEFRQMHNVFMTHFKVQPGDLDPEMRISSNSDYGRIIALYDNLNRSEIAHVSRIAEQVTLTKIGVPSTRHSTVRCFIDTPIFSQLVSLSRAGDEAGLQRLARRQRKANSLRAYCLGLTLFDRRSRWGFDLYDRHAAVLETKERLQLGYQFAEMAFRSGNLAWAIPTLEMLTERHPDHVRAHQLLLEAYQKLGDLPGGIRILRRLVALVPDQAELREKLICALMRLPDFEQAQTETDRALDRFSDNQRLLDLAAELQRQMMSTPEACPMTDLEASLSDY